MKDGRLALTAILPMDDLRRLIRAEVERVLQQRSPESEPYLDAWQAARYYGYDGDRLNAGRRRVYDLVASGRLRCKKDGTRSLFRREWLDAALDG